MKKALITGITGQDGSYLAEFLLSKDYVVHGLVRRASTFTTKRIDHLFVDRHSSDARLHLHYGDMGDPASLSELIRSIRPDEIYNNAAQSNVRLSFDMPEYTGRITGLGVTTLLQVVVESGIEARFYQASSSEIFGSSPPPQNEASPFLPRSPYGAAKLYAHWITGNFREAHGIFCCSGILFNHESPRRGETFVTRKITRAIAAILAGKQEKMYLGNLDAKRDWGFAPEYIEAQWMMMQKDEPADYVIGTGESRSVREFLEQAFGYAGLDWSEHVEFDPAYLRPTEVDELRADPAKARIELGWESKTNFGELVRILVDAELEMAGIEPPGEGLRLLAERDLGWTTRSGGAVER